MPEAISSFDAIRNRIQSSLPVDGCRYAAGYRDALESVLLALQADTKDTAESSVKDAFDAALDAFGNHDLYRTEGILVTLNNGDTAFFLDGELMQSAEFACGEDVGAPEKTASILARAGIPVRFISMNEPSDPDWNWLDVFELLPSNIK
jgi:hypothetical protein